MDNQYEKRTGNFIHILWKRYTTRSSWMYIFSYYVWWEGGGGECLFNGGGGGSLFKTTRVFVYLRIYGDYILSEKRRGKLSMFFCKWLNLYPTKLPDVIIRQLFFPDIFSRKPKLCLPIFSPSNFSVFTLIFSSLGFYPSWLAYQSFCPSWLAYQSFCPSWLAYQSFCPSWLAYQGSHRVRPREVLHN